MKKLLFLLLMLSPGLFPAESIFALRDHDTVLFYGDSITEQGFFTNFVDTFVATRYPKLNIRFVNSAWGGENATGGNGGPVDLRLTRDVLPYKPTVMTLMLGMNDGKYQAWDEPVATRYNTAIEHILQVVKQAFPDLRITLIQPSAYDDVAQEPLFPGGYNAVLVRYGDFIRETAKQRSMPVVDMNAPMVDVLRKALAASPADAKRLMPDRIHPTPGVHLVMAEALLKTWGASPLVSDVVIDAAAKKVEHTENTQVTKLDVAASVTWTQQDQALPFPLDFRDRSIPITLRRAAAGAELVLKSSDFVEALNQQRLRVRGLTAAQYTLKINGVAVGSFPREQLESGLNLATLPTPMAKQAQEVLKLVFKKTQIHQLRWRDIQVNLANDHLSQVPTLEASLDALEDELAQREHAAAQPVACSYELIPQPTVP